MLLRISSNSRALFLADYPDYFFAPYFFLFSNFEDIEVFFEHDEELDFEGFKSHFKFPRFKQEYHFTTMEEDYEDFLDRLGGEFEDEDFFDLELSFNSRFRYMREFFLKKDDKVDKKDNPLLFLRYKKNKKAVSL
jgi:hypothetical protein